MQTQFIKFLSEPDRVRGFYELILNSRVGSFPDQVYQVSVEALKILDDLHIAYRRASDAEVKEAHDKVRELSPAFPMSVDGHIRQGGFGL